MSSAFLKKSLELVDSDFKHRTKVVKREGNEKVYSQLKIINKKKKAKDHRGAADVRRKNIESIEKIRREHKKKLNRKVNKISLELLHKPVKDKFLTKILDHIGRRGINEKVENKEEKTAFTEEDFAKFEKEYFGSSR